ncbi:MAG TPA: LysM peptidoglycan-binding domain-containing protein [Candidatus Saccharimonadales bacterium]|nr:LysM peptidoglycan-binding domain-containing protein [Candidatus Saccharimonadales bacterium]
MKQTLFIGRTNSSKRAKGGPKSTTIAAYSGVFLLVISMVAIGYQPPQKTDNVASAANPLASSAQTSVSQPSVDEIVATSIAAGIAERANLPVASNIANQSVSLAIQSKLAQNDTNTITKPQIIRLSADNRDVTQYVVKEGDTVESIATEFGISTNTIKWANGLASNSVDAGKTLAILPVDGVLYTVKSGDTVESIAAKFNTTTSIITSFNDLELTGLVVNEKIILPSGILPTTERPGYQAPQTFSVNTYANAYNNYRYAGGFAGGNVFNIRGNFKSTTPGNTNAWGNCTWYAWERRLEMGRPLPSGALGHAAQWNTSLGAMGYLVNRTPSVGAIFQNGGGFGHVGIVEALNADGSIVVSEMNNYSGGGYNGINDRIIPANQVSSFNYIHG